ncbi:MAG TPA: class I lanthipeptide [Thermoanaerobaculia bacterium]|nr:class I lanthipeptide [Thermoanaerobaculia bacterium]
MKKKEVTTKLQLNRETLRALEQADLMIVQGAAVSQLYTCRPCSGAHTDLC